MEGLFEERERNNEDLLRRVLLKVPAPTIPFFNLVLLNFSFTLNSFISTAQM